MTSDWIAWQVSPPPPEMAIDTYRRGAGVFPIRADQMPEDFNADGLYWRPAKGEALNAKVIQIAAAGEELYLLRDDGTVWMSDDDSETGWRRVPLP